MEKKQEKQEGRKKRRGKRKKREEKICVFSLSLLSLLSLFIFLSLFFDFLLFSLCLFWLRTGVWSRFPRQQRLNAGQSVLSQSGNATEKGKAAKRLFYILTKNKVCRSDEKDDGIQHSALTACFFGEKKKNTQPPPTLMCVLCVCDVIKLSPETLPLSL